MDFEGFEDGGMDFDQLAFSQRQLAALQRQAQLKKNDSANNELRALREEIRQLNEQLAKLSNTPTSNTPTSNTPPNETNRAPKVEESAGAKTESRANEIWACAYCRKKFHGDVFGNGFCSVTCSQFDERRVTNGKTLFIFLAVLVAIGSVLLVLWAMITPS